MKKLLVILITVLTLTSCMEVGVRNNIGDDNQEIILQVDTNQYRVVYVNVHSAGSGFYMLVPLDSKVSLPGVIGYKQGKSNTSVITIK